MEKHNKKRASLRQYPVLLAFGLFFLGLFVLELVTPDRAYSELENTTLAQRPKLTAPTADGLNNYFTGYTKYVKDQMFGRDEWISLQGFVETALFQKTENGGILLGKEHQMFPRTYSLLSSETRALPKNTAALESLCQRYPGKVNVMLVPAASVIYPENVPAGAPLLHEEPYLDQLSSAIQAAGGRFVDVRDPLRSHKDEYLYYRTDHHWTSLGAYYAYRQLCEALGLTPFDPAAHTALTRDGFYGTHYSKARTWNAVPDTITYYELQNALTIWNVTGPGPPTEGTTTALNDPDKPIRLNSEEDTRFYHCNIKTLNLLPSVMTAQRAKLAGMSETVFHRGDIVTECAHSNVSVLKDGIFYSHPNDELILRGIAKTHMLQACYRLGITVMEKPITVDFLRDADEIIVTSSSNFCLHACEFEGKPAGGKDPATLKAIQDEVLKEFYDYTGCESLWG